MLRIDFLLGSPIVLDFPIHLDAIIDNVWAYETGLYKEPLQDPRQYKRSGVFKETNGVAHASIGLLVGLFGVEYWHKRFDFEGAEMIDFKKNKEQIRIGSGTYKNYQMPLRVVAADKITFFAEGDEDKIIELAKKTTHIGKKHAYGYGKVLDVEWQEIEPSDAVFIRNLPTSLFEKPVVRSQRLRAGWRTPYWYRADYQECWVPVRFVFNTEEELQNFMKGGE